MALLSKRVDWRERVSFNGLEVIMKRRISFSLMLVFLIHFPDSFADVLIDDQAQCKDIYVIPNPKLDWHFTWSGQCANGYFEGYGLLDWFDKNNKLMIHKVGNFSGGFLHGEGIETYSNGTRVKGVFRYGSIVKGEMCGPNGVCYQGPFVGGMFHGKGVMNWPNGNHYEGDFVAGNQTGKGIFIMPNIIRYEGDFVDGLADGIGIMSWPNGNQYKGGFVAGDMTGQGKLVFADGTVYEGNFLKSQFNGQGIESWPNGNRYKGEFVAGKSNGNGLFTWADGACYEGGFVDGKQSGKGKVDLPNGDSYEGSFVDGDWTGHGVFISKSKGGRLEGNFFKGLYIDPHASY